MFYLDLSLALIVFMGLVSGGMLSLVLMTTRRYQYSFSIILGLAALLAIAGAFASVAEFDRLSEGLANAMVLLVLAFALGYTLTTFSVLSYAGSHKAPEDAQPRGDRTAVIHLAPGEPPEYGVQSGSRRLALADDQEDVPPMLLRPFYLRDLRSKYAAVGSSPYRDYHLELAQKVQMRLDSNHTVYAAFYSDQPGLAATISRAIGEGAGRIVLLHVRVTDPPESVKAGDLLEGLDPSRHGVKMQQVGPLWDSDLLPQIYVRRVLEALPQVSPDPQATGLLLVGRGHPSTEGKGNPSSVRRFTQETAFQNRVRQALIKMGLEGSKMATGWLRWNQPTVHDAFQSLVSAGCKAVIWMPSSFSADGVNTLYDVPAQISSLAKSQGITVLSLGGWNADDLAAEDIAARIRATSRNKPIITSGARSAQ